MVLNAAVQMLREADELKQKILKIDSETSMLEDRGLWTTQQQLQNVYQKILMLDLDYALDKKVEQDLWNVGFKQQIEALQAISKDRKHPHRSDGQAMLSWVLQAAAGFYLCLLHQICTTFKLDLPFRRRASLLGSIEAWGPGASAAPAAARYASQHCLVHLGDLARYRQQLRVAHTFYRHALAVSPHSGQPYNQLALVAWRRGRRLAAIYWHVRSMLVRAPFPPAPGNLARTLAAASRDVKEAPVPVLPGLTTDDAPTSTPMMKTERLDSHSYVTELIRAIYYIHTVEQLDVASDLVNILNNSFTPLVATNSFESMTLIKMSCVLIWLVQCSSEELSNESALTVDEVEASRLAASLAASTVLALLLPAYTAPEPPKKALPALKVWLQWLVDTPRALSAAAWRAKPQLWPALAHSLMALGPKAALLPKGLYDTVPLPEDEELHGFLPLEDAFKGLKFSYHTTWDTYGGRLPELEAGNDGDTGSSGVAASCFTGEPELEERLRAHRLIALGRHMADLNPDQITYTTSEDGTTTFTASTSGGEQLSLALAELSLAAAERPPEPEEPEEPDDSDDERPPPPPPVVISEADFREKVREKRVGILKPQGSLERAREERALAFTQDQQDVEEDTGKSGEDKKEVRKPRVNIAMAAIMRKQEETNKQVKFASPPPTPDSVVDPGEAETKESEKPKMAQPKAIKSLSNLPIGRKTGGILSLKDKSGYPHLVNTDPEPAKKEKEDKKEIKNGQGNSQSQQNYPQKWQDPLASWPGAGVPPQPFNEPRLGFQKNYGIQNTGLSYNPNQFGQGIRLPVVSPKEIDVRSAALQKQSSRPELFAERAFAPLGPLSPEKKAFLSDLPPRFANQYRYWHHAVDAQHSDNKFRDDTFKQNFEQQQQQQQPLRNWSNPQPEYQQPVTWWKTDTPNFNSAFPAQAPPMNVQPNFFPHLPNAPNPYLNLPYNQNQQKPETTNWQSIAQPQIPTLQNLVTSPNFNTLNNFTSYTPSVGYDSSMYPQFNKLGYQPVQMKMPDKPYQPKEMDEALNFAPGMEHGPRNLTFNSGATHEAGNGNPLDQGMMQVGECPAGGSTYSLFSAAPEPAGWQQRRPHQSLWSGPGPSPLERLLEQQKQLQPPPNPH